MKICKGCSLELDETEFYKKGKSISYYCKSCTRTRQREYERTHPLSKRKSRNALYHRKRLGRYNMTQSQFELLMARQLNRCAICGTEAPRWYIDHNHKDEKVRGLLCFSCNVGLGAFKDNIISLKAAIAYLQLPYRMVEL